LSAGRGRLRANDAHAAGANHCYDLQSGNRLLFDMGCAVPPLQQIQTADAADLEFLGVFLNF
jgi:hypothetical protein